MLPFSIERIMASIVLKQTNDIKAPMNKISLMFSSKQTALLSHKVNQTIQNVISSEQFIMGKEVTELEEKLSKFIGYKHGIACANGTDALMLALMALGLKNDEVVFTPSFTFIATAEAIAILGGIPYFVDVDESFNISIASLKDSIEDAKNRGLKVKGIISVDLFGKMANYDELRKIADENNLFFISDAAQSFGARSNNTAKPDILTTSFFPTKPLGCYGDGGMMFTDSDNIAQTLKSLTMHGKGADKYNNIRIGTNSRLDTLQAAVLLEKLNYFENEITVRNETAESYNQALNGLITTPKKADGDVPTWAVYTLLDPRRDTIIEKLKDAGIPSNIYYHTPLHNQVAYREYPKASNLLNSAKYSKECFCLPMHGYLTQDEISYITTELKKILKGLDEDN